MNAAIEEEGRFRSRQRPESCRPRCTVEYQERAAFVRIPREFIQSTKGRQASYDELLDGLKGTKGVGLGRKTQSILWTGSYIIPCSECSCSVY